MCGVTRNDKIRNEHIGGTTRVTQAAKKDHGETTELVRACDEELRKVLRTGIPGKGTRG